MRAVNRLTTRFVQTIKAPGYHADGAGLYLVVDKQGSKRWAFIFQWHRKRKEMGLGPVITTSLAEARVKADDARKLVARGVNPIEDRKRAVGYTFADASEDLIAALKAGWRGKVTEASWRNSLESHAKPIRGKQVFEIVTEDVLEILKPVWIAKPEIAQKTRGRIEQVLDAARAKGRITPPWENPARWRGHLEHMLAKPIKLSRGHHAALSYKELPAFLVKLASREAIAARALEFAILTAARTDEVLKAVHAEIKPGEKLWVIPGDRMKGGKEHQVPLSKAALERVQDYGSAFLFPGFKEGRPLSNRAMEAVLERMGREDITVHGFRSTFRDWAGDMTDFPEEIVEAALAHAVKGQVQRAYRRGTALERRRALMDAWAAYCYPTPPAPSDPPQE